MRWLCSTSEKRSSASSSSVARGDSLAWCELRDGGGSPLLMARSCFVRASCAMTLEQKDHVGEASTV